MAKQDEIREGIAMGLIHHNAYEWAALDKTKQLSALAKADRIINYLHSQGLRFPNGEALIDETDK